MVTYKLIVNIDLFNAICIFSIRCYMLHVLVYKHLTCTNMILCSLIHCIYSIPHCLHTSIICMCLVFTVSVSLHDIMWSAVFIYFIFLKEKESKSRGTGAMAGSSG